MKPNIIITGPSGSGKSSSMRNLQPKRTAVLNTERKQLPFKNAKDFMNVPIKSVSEFHSALDKAMSRQNRYNSHRIIYISYRNYIQRSRYKI